MASFCQFWKLAILCLIVDIISAKMIEQKNIIKPNIKQKQHTEFKLDHIWETYKKVHNKVYDSVEDMQRRKIWEENTDRVRVHNLEYDMGLHTYTMGINEYADLSFEEYRHYLLGAIQPSKPRNNTKVFKPSLDTVKSLPNTVDWRTKGYVTPIKNQGQCGSCWAFSSTGSLEGQHFKKTGNLVSLSEQNLVDCDKTNAGCGGGWMDNAFNYVQSNGGIDTEEYYPYQAKDMPDCTYNDQDIGSDCTAHVDIEKGSETGLKAAVATVGPISVAIDATHQSFQLYKSGVYTEPQCSNVTTDHAVLAVGYGEDNGQPYWLVKNSWGTSWGMDGYIMMARNQDNQCAIASFACYPIV
jgi:cathepsin L